MRFLKFNNRIRTRGLFTGSRGPQLPPQTEFVAASSVKLNYLKALTSKVNMTRFEVFVGYGQAIGPP